MECKKEGDTHKEKQGFQLALKVGENKNFVGRTLMIQWFCHAKGNIQKISMNQN